MSRKVAFRVVVDGVEITDTINRRLSSASLTVMRGDEADKLTLVLSNQDDKLNVPRKGVLITFALGWQGEPLKNMGTFKVDETTWCNNPAQIEIAASSADFTADMRIRRERSWRNTTLGAVLSDIAAGGGLKTSIAEGLANKPVKMLAQSRESDLALMRRLGRDYDAVATIKAGSLIFAPIGSGKTASGKALPSLKLADTMGDRITIKSASRGDYGGVTATWHDGNAAERKTVTVGEKKGARRLKAVHHSEAAARQAAEAEWSRIQRAAADLDMVLALGRADLFPECRFTLAIEQPWIATTTWLVKQVSHAISKSGGWTTAIQAETAPPLAS